MIFITLKSTHIAFLRNAFLGVHYFYKHFLSYGTYFIWENFLQIQRSYGTHFQVFIISTNLSFLWNFILFGKIFYTYSVPTERLSCWFIISTNLSFLRNLFYLGKFSTHIAFLRNAFLGGHYFYKPFVPTELIYLGKFSTNIAFLRNASQKSNLPSSSFQHPY